MDKTEIRKGIRAERQKYTPRQFAGWSADICRHLLAHPAVAQAKVIAAYHPLPDEPDIRPVIWQLHQQGKTILLPQVIDQSHMQFLPYSGDDHLAEGAFHIMEPNSGQRLRALQPSTDSGQRLRVLQPSTDSGQRLRALQPSTDVTTPVPQGNEATDGHGFPQNIPRPSTCATIPCGEVGSSLFLIPGMAFTADGKRLGRGRGYYDRFLSSLLPRPYKIGICYPYQLLPTLPTESHDMLMDEIITAS